MSHGALDLPRRWRTGGPLSHGFRVSGTGPALDFRFHGNDEAAGRARRCAARTNAARARFSPGLVELLHRPLQPLALDRLDGVSSPFDRLVHELALVRAKPSQYVFDRIDADGRSADPYS